MKTEISVTINTGNYENIKIGVSEAANFDEAEKAIKDELERLHLTLKVIR